MEITNEQMNYYKLKYANGDIKIVKAKDELEVIRRYDLCSRDNVETRVFRLSGEQEAIARANED